MGREAAFLSDCIRSGDQFRSQCWKATMIHMPDSQYGLPTCREYHYGDRGSAASSPKRPAHLNSDSSRPFSVTRSFSPGLLCICAAGSSARLCRRASVHLCPRVVCACVLRVCACVSPCVLCVYAPPRSLHVCPRVVSACRPGSSLHVPLPQKAPTEVKICRTPSLYWLAPA